MLGSINKFAKNRSGVFAMQFALMVVPLCACTGLAIDGGRAFLARFELASALDAAALAVGSIPEDQDLDLDDVARKFVEMNFKTEHDDPIALELVDIGGEDEALMLRGSVQINTFFMPIIGQPYVTVEAESEVRRGGANVEVTLALDVTGSMAGTRIAALKTASKILIDEVVSSAQVPFYSKVAVVPWAQSVNIANGSDDFVTSTALAELRGDIRGATDISNASWRNGSTTTKTISSAGWRTNSGKSVSGATWKNGSAFTISEITKTNSNTRIRVRLSSDPAYANDDTIVITGAGGSYTGLNGSRYKVADRTTSSPYYVWLQNLGTTTYTTPPSGSTNSTGGSSQRCLYTGCEMRIKANSHGFVTGDFIYLNGVGASGGGLSVNNTWGQTWTITYRDSDYFTLDGTNGALLANYSSGGTASECYVADCRYLVTMTASHDFAATDPLFFWGITETGTGTSLNTAANNSITVANPSAAIFYLPGDARNYKTWTSGGSVAECANQFCNVEVTSNSHGLSAGERVEIKSVGGLTGINTCALSTSGTCSSGTRLTWPIRSATSNAYVLTDTTPALTNMANTFTSGGTSQCTTYGCARLRFLNSSNAERLFRSTTCLVERPGGQAYTDASTLGAGQGLGILYTGGGTCDTNNYVTPLTSNKSRLNTAIDELVTGGATAGQIGAAWAWYMTSPNFADVWDDEGENRPAADDADDLIKVAVLMTDGEFNYESCYGVARSSLSSTFTSSNCDTKNTFEQAQTTCTNMKAAGIVVYTVGLELGTSTDTINFLTNCASNPQYAHLAADAAELQTAFKKIAQSISRLRIAR